MLQLSGTLRNATVRITPLSSWRISSQILVAASSRATNPSPLLAQAKDEDQSTEKSKTLNNKTPLENPMIQAAFNNLKRTKVSPTFIANDPDVKTNESVIETKIKMSENVESLLNIAKEKNITRENAFAIVTLLLDWVNNGKAKLKVFELDSRFLHLCTLLSRPKMPEKEMPKIQDHNKTKRTKKFLDELNLFYNINEINEASKEIANLPVQHMIKVMYGLAHQKRRSTPLLRALSFNISRSSEALNVKELSDLLYSMAVLNFVDEVLLQQVCSALLKLAQTEFKSAIIGSMLRSLGTLRYKDEKLLDKMSEWAVDHSKVIRPQDLCSLFCTLAMLDYKPANIEVLNNVVIEHLSETDMTKSSEWLDVVWSLTILQVAQNRHIASVLDSDFLKKLTADSIEIPMLKKHKLLNINAAAQLLIKDYKGPLLESVSDVFDTEVRRSKEKEVYVRTVLGTLDNMFPNPEYSKININTGMGFVLDAEICINSQGKRMPVKSNKGETKDVRIAVMAQYYHDFCRGKQDPLGFNSFYYQILEAKGYKILTIPYTEFSAEDKIVQRITYINDRIKKIAK